MRLRRLTVAVTILLSLLCVASGASVGGTPTPSATPTQDGAATHTLVITAQNGSGSYTVTASGTIQLSNGESSDYQLRGSRLTGTVGEQGDAKDVIQYTGYIESFQADGQVQVALDGQQIPPSVLGGQHIRITRAGNSSQPILYQFYATERARHGELAENDDTVSKTRVRGRVRDQADSFYFTGVIKNNSVSVTGPATVMINGRNASVFLTNAPPTPPTPRSSRSSPSPTVTPTSPATSTLTPPPSPTRSPSPVPRGNSGFSEMLGGIITGFIIIVIVGAIAVLYQ